MANIPDDTLGRWDRLTSMRSSPIRAIHDISQAVLREDPSRDLIALHFGEPDQGTPPFIVDAACHALRAGAHFYEPNSGRADLKQALAEHHSQRHQIEISADRFVVTCGGTQAIALAALALLSPGDQVLMVTPCWPNLTESARIAGAEVHELPLVFDRHTCTFRMDLDRLKSRADELPSLRMVMVNSPSNPTGWVIQPEQQRALIAFCQHHGLYLVSDEIYDRIIFDGHPFRSALENGWDRMVVINGFSKTYCMTGWRLGYLITEPKLAASLARMQEFVTSHAPSMAQVAGITALRDGEPFVAANLERYRGLRELVVERLGNTPGVTIAHPQGTFYVFFKIDGVTDSFAWCRDLLVDCQVILAPGNAFGRQSDGWFRICFANEPSQLLEGLARLRAYLESKRWRDRFTGIDSYRHFPACRGGPHTSS